MCFVVWVGLGWGECKCGRSGIIATWVLCVKIVIAAGFGPDGRSFAEWR